MHRLFNTLVQHVPAQHSVKILALQSRYNDLKKQLRLKLALPLLLALEVKHG